MDHSRILFFVFFLMGWLYEVYGFLLYVFWLTTWLLEMWGLRAGFQSNGVNEFFSACRHDHVLLKYYICYGQYIWATVSGKIATSYIDSFRYQLLFVWQVFYVYN